MAFSTARVAIAKPGTPIPHDIPNLMGGANDSVSEELIADNELSRVRNYMPDHLNAGVLIKRPGVTKHLANQQSEKGTSVYQGRNGNYFTTTATIKQFADNTDLSSGGLSNTTAPDWTTLATMDIYVNGTDSPKKITSGPSYAALGGTPPTFKYVEAFNNFVFGAGHSNGVLRYSGLGAPETWTATHSITVTNDDNDDIMGLVKYNSALMVMCEKSFHRVRGTTALQIGIAQSFFGTGTTSHRSLVPTPFGLFWWSDRGLVKTTSGMGDADLDFVTMRKIPRTLEAFNRSQFALVHGSWHPRLECVQMYVPKASGTAIDSSIWYFPRTDSVWVMDGAGVEMGASGAAIISGVWDVYAVSASTSGYLYKQTGEDDDSIPIEAYLETKKFDDGYGHIAIKKTHVLSPAFITNRTHTVDYGVYVDNERSLASGNKWTLQLTGSGGIIFGQATISESLIFGGGLESFEDYVGKDISYHKIKHRIADSSAYRTRVRGIFGRSTLVSI